MKKIALLESVRGLAALYVFLTHFLLIGVLDKSTRFGFLFRFGQESVMVFFLLSGFVIFYSVHAQEKRQECLISFRPYFWRRWVRIFPIFLFALAITYLCTCLNAKAIVPLNFWQLLGNIAMLQDFGGGKHGVWVNTFVGNAALWSLSYEWWFYMMFFPVHIFIVEQKQKWVVFLFSIVGAISYFVIPNQISLFLSYFVIWWTGVEVARVYVSGQRPTLRNAFVPYVTLWGVTLLQIVCLIIDRKVRHSHLSFGLNYVLICRHFVAACLICGIALILPIPAFRFLSRLLQPYAVLAPISYALYVLHFPITVNATYLHFLGVRPIELFCYVAIAFSLAAFAEIPFQKWISDRTRTLRA